ncbi:hypothetical protein BGX34_006368 [Mortierella sp. NVP85]|nr:hypothetical protein BGX34_006368 [Mortierella sp. NVP85]
MLQEVGPEIRLKGQKKIDATRKATPFEELDDDEEIESERKEYQIQVVNPWMLKDLVDRGLWSDSLKKRIITGNGSIQNISGIPDDLKSQSLNVHMADVNFGKLTSMAFYGWRKGLKTGMYYLRTRAAVDAIKFTVDQLAIAKNEEAEKMRRMRRQ